MALRAEPLSSVVTGSGAALLLPRGFLLIPRDMFDLHNWGVCYWQLGGKAKDAANHLTCTGQPPQQNYQPQHQQSRNPGIGHVHASLFSAHALLSQA